MPSHRFNRVSFEEVLALRRWDGTLPNEDPRPPLPIEVQRMIFWKLLRLHYPDEVLPLSSYCIYWDLDVQRVWDVVDELDELMRYMAVQSLSVYITYETNSDFIVDRYTTVRNVSVWWIADVDDIAHLFDRVIYWPNDIEVCIEVEYCRQNGLPLEVFWWFADFCRIVVVYPQDTLRLEIIDWDL